MRRHMLAAAAALLMLCTPAGAGVKVTHLFDIDVASVRSACAENGDPKICRLFVLALTAAPTSAVSCSGASLSEIRAVFMRRSETADPRSPAGELVSDYYFC